ncbi:hypothetical protein NQ315_004348 [Exocentrus adspersus]|uniref:Targeting protein for Xklp2 n=1 Tax=Exocentrus adspersus TaxID=1586481 RepID=A0AAV8W6W9_9CUCU|nr:hypothetical protein NQ315_004348 [Exocentrus adspersus]
MSANFDSYNAPQFFDFNEDLHKDDDSDGYFDVDHENTQPFEDPLQDPLITSGANGTPYQDILMDFSPVLIPGYDYYKEETDTLVKPRRSMSVGDLRSLYTTCDEDQEETLIGAQLEGISLSKAGKEFAEGASSSNSTKVRSEIGNSFARFSKIPRALSKESLNRLAQPKRYNSSQNLYQQENYVSMAEAVRKFQCGTPERFHTKRKLNTDLMGKLRITIPQSPALLTKNRHRPVQAVSKEEQEKLSFEQAQKFKIRANPLNKKILQGPVKPLLPAKKKPATVVEPFKITEPKKTAKSPVRDTYRFHANPVPKTLLEWPKRKPVQTAKQLTMPKTPDVLKRYGSKESLKRQESLQKAESKETKHPVKLGRTIPEPFSFERRDIQMQKKKEELVKKAIEEEKKAREFHARPVPKTVLNSGRSNQSSSSDTNTKKDGSNENLACHFKARPATVLHKKPFEPKKERFLTEIDEFELNTEKRAAEREIFEQYKKEKEERFALLKEFHEKVKLKLEEDELAKLRKATECKAQPIRKYKQLQIQPSGKVTVPKSPNFQKRRNNADNKENKS